MLPTLYWYIKYPHDDELKTKNSFFILKKDLEEHIRKNPDQKAIQVFSDNFRSLIESLDIQLSEYTFGSYTNWEKRLYLTRISNERMSIVLRNIKIKEQFCSEYKVILFALEEEFFNFSIEEDFPEIK